MTIRGKVSFSFILLSFFIICIGTISLVSLYQIEEDSGFGRKVYSLIKLQEEMNELIIQTIDEKNIGTFVQIKNKFKLFEEKFEELEEKILNKKSQTFVLRDIHKNSIISQSLNKLFKNEQIIEKTFESIYEEQKEKLEKISLFLNLYPSEKNKRKSLQKIIFSTKNLHLIQEFGNLKYYSKETLYQHKREKYLNQWLGSIDTIIEGLKSKKDLPLKLLFKEYKQIVIQIGAVAIGINKLEEKAALEISSMKRLLNENRQESLFIENEISSVIDRYINAVLTTQFILVSVIIFVTLFLTGMISSRLRVVISKLTHGAKQLQKKNYDAKIEINEDTEFNSVAITFNQMAGNLKEHQENLENKISQRTQELQEALVEVESKKNMMENLSNKLSKYLSPQVFESIFTGQQDVNLTSKRKYLTVFFSDIKDFTSLTDTVETEVLTQILNEYLDEMSQITIKHGGTIDKYIGDSIMVFFGDPNSLGKEEDAKACINMAIEMKHMMNKLKVKWNKEGVSNPFQVRMGISSGYCTVGNFGSKNRMDYTIVGGVVNLASRLESTANANEILISSETYALIKSSFSCKKQDVINVKGIAHDVQTYEIESNSHASSILLEDNGVDLMIDLNEVDKKKVVQQLQEKIEFLQKC